MLVPGSQFGLDLWLVNALKLFFPKNHPESGRKSGKIQNRWAQIAPRPLPKAAPDRGAPFDTPETLFGPNLPLPDPEILFAFILTIFERFFAFFDEPAEPYNEMDLGFGISRKNDAECDSGFICS